MNERIFAGAAALMTSMAGLTGIARVWPTPTGRHRATAPLLLPDEPIPASTEPVPHVVLDEGELEQQLADGDVLANEFDLCPDEGRTTFHALYRDGSRRCWTCGVETAGGGE